MSDYNTVCAEQLLLLKQNPPGEMIHLMVLVRLRPEPPSGGKAGNHGAYRQFCDMALASLRDIGARTLCLGSAARTLIGPTDEHWDWVYIIECPDSCEFSQVAEKLSADPAVGHWAASVKNARVLHMRPTETW